MPTYKIAEPVWNLMFGEKFPAIVAGEPFTHEVTNQAGRTFVVQSQDVITLRHTLPRVNKATGEIITPAKPYWQLRPQSTAFLRSRPLDGTPIRDPLTGDEVKYLPVEGLDFEMDDHDQMVALTLNDLVAKSAQSTSEWQAAKRAGRVSLSAIEVDLESL